MEGHTLKVIRSIIINEDFTRSLFSHFYYLGIIGNFQTKSTDPFYYFEYNLRINQLDINELEKHIEALFMEEHLQIMQCTYILSKVKSLNNKIIKKLVVTNPYTNGLKNLMLAFNSSKNDEKKHYFEVALKNLFHIKYYYLE